MDYDKKILLDELDGSMKDVANCRKKIIKVLERCRSYDYESANQALYITKDRMDEILNMLESIKVNF